MSLDITVNIPIGGCHYQFTWDEIVELKKEFDKILPPENNYTISWPNDHEYTPQVQPIITTGSNNDVL